MTLFHWPIVHRDALPDREVEHWLSGDRPVIRLGVAYTRREGDRVVARITRAYSRRRALPLFVALPAGRVAQKAKDHPAAAVGVTAAATVTVVLALASLYVGGPRHNGSRPPAGSEPIRPGVAPSPRRPPRPGSPPHRRGSSPPPAAPTQPATLPVHGVSHRSPPLRPSSNPPVTAPPTPPKTPSPEPTSQPPPAATTCLLYLAVRHVVDIRVLCTRQ